MAPCRRTPPRAPRNRRPPPRRPSTRCTRSSPAGCRAPPRRSRTFWTARPRRGSPLAAAYDVAGLRADADLMVWWHAATADDAAGRLPPAAAHRRWAASWSRSGRRWRCTGRPSSTRATSRRSWPARSRGATSASTRSSAPTSGTCCPTRSAARCSPSTARWRRDYPDVRANTVAVVRARRLRVDARVRGRRAAPHRRPDARTCAASTAAAARPRGDPVLHRPPRPAEVWAAARRLVADAACAESGSVAASGEPCGGLQASGEIELMQ